jgi:hypothetical protein
MDLSKDGGVLQRMPMDMVPLQNPRWKRLNRHSHLRILWIGKRAQSDSAHVLMCVRSTIEMFLETRFFLCWYHLNPFCLWL